MLKKDKMKKSSILKESQPTIVSTINEEGKEVKKLDQVDMESIKSFQARLQENLMALGDLTAKIEITASNLATSKEKQKEFVDVHSKLMEEEVSLGKLLESKYGSGVINMTTEEITIS